MADVDPTTDPAPPGPTTETPNSTLSNLPPMPKDGPSVEEMEASSLDPKELLDSFDELLEEFKDEFAEINAKDGLADDDSEQFRKHQEFLRANWVFTIENITNLLMPHVKSKNIKELVKALGFIVTHTLSVPKIKSFVQAKVAHFKENALPFIINFPHFAKSYILEKDKNIWKRRAKKEGVYILGTIVAFLAVTNAHRLIPEETYEDIEAELARVELVDLSDPKRPIKNLLPLPTVLAYLKEGGTIYRLLQFDMVMECDSLMTLAEIDSEAQLAQIRNVIAAHMVDYSYEDLNSKEEKETLKENLIKIVKGIIPSGNIYAVYFTRWVFAPMDIRKPGQ